MKRYRSKIDWWLIAIILIACFSPLMANLDLEGLLTTIGALVLVILLVWPTDYTIDGDTLKVRAGFIIRRRYNISEIKSISRSHNILGAPACSLDRLRIDFEDGKMELISPVRKDDFINDLLTQNGKIKVWQT